MAQLPLDEGIPRFKSNEDKFDQFINGDVDTTIPVESGILPSLSAVIARLLSEGGNYYDTLSAAIADIPNMRDNQTFSVINDGANNGVYVNKEGVPEKVSDLTLEAVNDQLKMVLAQLSSVAEAAIDKGQAYDNDNQFGVSDTQGNLALAVNKAGETILKFTRGAMSEEYSFYAKGDDGSILLSIRREDGHGVIGLRPEIDVHVYGTGEDGSRTIWASADGYVPWALTPTPGDYHAERVEGIHAKWTEIVGGLAVTRKATLEPRVSPLDASVLRLVLVEVAGQSLGTGAYDSVVVHSNPVWPGRAISFNYGARVLPNHDPEGITLAVQPEDIAYWINLREQNQKISRSLGETVCSGAAAFLGRSGNATPTDTGVLFGVTAIGGQPFANISKSTLPYNNGLILVQRSAELMVENSLTVSLKIIILMNGESDRTNTEAQFTTKLLQYQTDKTADNNTLASSTGETFVIIHQLCNWTAFTTNNVRSEVPFAQHSVALNHPDKFAISCTGYFVPYYLADGVHLTGEAEAILGAYDGRVIERKLAGEEWMHMHCSSVERSGQHVVMTFHVPDGNLVIDTNLVTDPGNRGIEWFDNGDGNSVSIVDSTIVVTGVNTIEFDLSDTPTGTGQFVGTGTFGTPGAHAGPETGPRTCIRDSSTDVTDRGFPMYNWCAIDKIPVVEV